MGMKTLCKNEGFVHTTKESLMGGEVGCGIFLFNNEIHGKEKYKKLIQLLLQTNINLSYTVNKNNK
jgi:hypothetical protein